MELYHYRLHFDHYQFRVFSIKVLLHRNQVIHYFRTLIIIIISWIDLGDKSLVEKKTDEKVARVEDSLKDLSSIKWRTEYNGKRLWPHDQWPERDLVNFPPYKLREVPNAVRWYCVPETWFKFFYEKTGVTGPYMFFYGLLVYGFSKEYIVLWYDFTEYLILAAAVITVVKK